MGVQRNERVAKALSEHLPTHEAHHLVQVRRFVHFPMRFRSFTAGARDLPEHRKVLIRQWSKKAMGPFLSRMLCGQGDEPVKMVALTCARCALTKTVDAMGMGGVCSAVG